MFIRLFHKNPIIKTLSRFNYPKSRNFKVNNKLFLRNPSLSKRTPHKWFSNYRSNINNYKSYEIPTLSEINKNVLNEFKQKENLSTLNKRLIEEIENLQYEKAEEIFLSSLESNSPCPPDDISFIIMVIYYCTLSHPARAVYTMELMIKLKFKPTIDCYHAFMDMYLRQNSEHLVLKWFNQISIAKLNHNQTSYNLLMKSYANHSPPDVKKVLKYFQEMKQRFGEVTSYTYGIIIEMYGLKMGDIDEALNWAKKMEDDGITKRDQYTKEVILKVYKIWKGQNTVETSNKHPFMVLYEFVKKNDINNAMDLWRKIKYNNIPYNADVYDLMIQMFNFNGKDKLAIDFFETMLKENIHPNPSTLRTILAIYKRLGYDDKIDEIRMKFYSL